MKKILTLLAGGLLFLSAVPSLAQIPGGGVGQSGAVTANHCTTWAANGLIKDGGAPCGTGSGSVTAVTVTTANGVSATVANQGTTPALTFTLGAITPSSVNGNTITTGTGTLTLGAVTLNAGAGGTLGSNAFTSTAYAPIASPTFTGTVTMPDTSSFTSSATTLNSPVSVVSTSFGLSGNISAALTTNGTRYKNAAATITDSTTAAGTVASAYTDVWGGNTIATGGNAITVTNYFGSFFKAPIAGTGITFTNKSALGADTVSIGGAAQSTNALAVTGTSAFAGVITNSDATASSSFSTGSVKLSGGLGVTGSVYSGNNVSSGASFLFGTVAWATRNGATGDVGMVTNVGNLYFNPASNINQLGAADASIAVAQNLKVQSVVAGTAAANGANWTLIGSLPTGTGTSGDIIIQTGVKTGSGTTQGTATNAVIIKGETQEFRLPQIASDAALTDTTVCQDTTNHGLHAGSGTAGICLGNVSSIRFKRDWRTINNGLTTLAALDPITYYYKEGFGDSGKREQYGFKAEDYAKVLPKLTRFDSEGKPNGLDMMGLIPVMVSATNAQQKEIINLTERVSLLVSITKKQQREIADLKARLH